MVSLQAIRESNSRIVTNLPSALVAVFIGATSGIGETTLKQFTKRARQPRIYFLGRREAEGKRIQTELKKINPEGEYHYLKYDVSLLKNVDEVCRHLKDREASINLLFLSCGTLISGRQTEEGLNYPTALVYYSRTRFIINLLPQLRKAQSLRRVITVAAGGKEGTIFPGDFQAKGLRVWSFRGHVTSMITLSLQKLSEQAPEVSFIHNYPGFVKTGLSRELTGATVTVSKIIFQPIMALLQIPIDETGERQIYFATSARFPSRNGSVEGVDRGENIGPAAGADGTLGGGVYSIDYEAEGTKERVQDLLKSLIEDGTAERAWYHTEEEFVRITGRLTL